MPFLFAGVLAIVVVAAPMSAATISIVNYDAPGEGFNDTTPVAPVGGNSGTTLGEQRLIAFQHAADIWGAQLFSDVEIKVAASFDPLSCSAGSATLGGAGPETVHRDFDNAPLAATWYTQALANSLAGVDLDPEVEDIFAIFSSVLGTTCPFPDGWYYGLDQSPPDSDIDFATVALHEIGHGLGFLTLVGLTTGAKFSGFDDIYAVHLENHATGLAYPVMTNAQRVAGNIATGNLHWTGPSVVASGVLLSGGREPISGHVEMYAPNIIAGGSSVSHFSTTLFPNEAMEPFYTAPAHDPGLALHLMYDIGWVPSDCGNGVLNGSEICDDGNTIRGDGCSSCEVDTCHACAGEPSVCSPDTGSPCDDGQACTTTDVCQAGVCTGAATPLVGCSTATEPGKGSLVMRDNASDKKDQFIWKFLKGDATFLGDFGNPPGGTDYLLCVYDRTGGVDTALMSLFVPGGAGWQTKSSGFAFKDKLAQPAGVRNLQLKTGVAGKSKIIVKGKGIPLPMTNLGALDLPLTVQLSNGVECWESVFENNVDESTSERFKAKSD